MDHMEVSVLPDDLNVETLSGLSLRSFCRFKCACKSWHAFSSDPNYNEKLPKIPTGLFCTFLPHNPRLELMDCCNGLVLGMRRSMDWSTRTITCHFIVCNPATREWTRLPNTPILAFSPSCSTQFYVFNFKRNPLSSFLSGLEVFSSDLSTWLVYDAWWNSSIPTVIGYPHLFIVGSLYLFSLRQNSVRRILILNVFEAMSYRIPPSSYLGQSRGAMHCALPATDWLAIQIWSLDYCLSMSNSFGRDDLAHYDSTQQCWNCVYEIAALDLEREVIFLFDCWANKLRSYVISNGELHELDEIEQDHEHVYEMFYHYVACYSKLPAYVPLPQPHLLEAKRLDWRTWRSKLLAVIGKSS
ncbi:hypothetical protein VPH35_107655 [Triticum aestivum]